MSILVTQQVLEVLITSFAKLANVRISQLVLEVIILTSSIPPVTRRYGPRIQSV